RGHYSVKNLAPPEDALPVEVAQLALDHALTMLGCAQPLAEQMSEPIYAISRTLNRRDVARQVRDMPRRSASFCLVPRSKEALSFTIGLIKDLHHEAMRHAPRSSRCSG